MLKNVWEKEQEEDLKKIIPNFINSLQTDLKGFKEIINCNHFRVVRRKKADIFLLLLSPLIFLNNSLTAITIIPC